MKTTWIIIPVWLIAGAVQAQKIIEKHFSFSQKESVSLDIQIADSIKVIPWDKDEVYVKASVNVNDNKDNDLYQWKFDDSGNTVSVSANFDDKAYKSKNDCNCCCPKSDIYCEVHIPSSARLSIQTIDGNLIFTKNTREIQAKTISGFIDLSAPSNLKADMAFKTITGTVYTDFPLEMGHANRSATTNFASTVNGGGNPINLETISGNIYFRKSQ